MNITIFGSGSMARGIGYRLVSAGNTVTLRNPHEGKAQKLADELNGLGKGKARSAREDDAIADGIVVLAVPYAAAGELVQRLGEKLKGKTVVDITNPLNATFDGLVTPPGSSAAEEIAKRLTPGARLVKAFNTTFAATLVQGEVGGMPLDVFVAGDDETAKGQIVELVQKAGLRVFDAGALSRARQLEALALLGITLQGRYNLGFKSAWKLVS
jgi:8-hydroxy-5-deazaflavin:NADPH oxidoreductase